MQGSETIKILNFDQATNTTGYSVFIDGKLTNYGTLLSNHKEKNTLERIKQMTDEIVKIIGITKPDFVVLENIQFQRNIATFKSLAQLQGCIMYHLNNLNIGYVFVEPSAWKSFCGIKGRKREEQKKNTIIYVKNKYNINVSEDIADAIGIGAWALDNLK